MALPLKSTIYTIYLVVLVALGILLSQGIRQYQLYKEHEAIISQTESLIFQFSIIREHVSESLIDGRGSKLSGISSEMEKLNSNLAAILAEKNIGDEYKLTFLNSIDLPGIILLLRKIEDGGDEIENLRNLNRDMRTLGERLILFDRVLVNNAKQKLIGFQNIIIGTAGLIVFILVTVLTLFHRHLILPLLHLVRLSTQATFDQDISLALKSPSREIASVTTTLSNLIRQRKALRCTLDNFKNSLASLVSSLQGMWVQISSDGSVIAIQFETAMEYGFNEKEFIGRHWRELFIVPENSMQHGDSTEEALLQVLAEGNKSILLSLAEKEGLPSRQMRCSFAKFSEDNSDSFVLYCLGVDLSEEYEKIAQLEKELAYEKNKKAEMVRTSHLSVLGELSTGIAHEMSNLSNGIINYAQILADSACDPDFQPERNKLFKKIIYEGDKISGLANNLLAYGQDDAQSRELAPVEDVLQNSLALMHHYFRIDGTTVETDLAQIPLCKVNGRQMQQVFLNILNNARRALNERFPQKDDQKLLKITANTIEKDGRQMLCLKFTDYGIGIAPENLQKVFEPSFSTKPSSEGVGMGLTVSREIMREQNGNIYLESEVEHHTTFTVELPLT